MAIKPQRLSAAASPTRFRLDCIESTAMISSLTHSIRTNNRRLLTIDDVPQHLFKAPFNLSFVRALMSWTWPITKRLPERSAEAPGDSLEHHRSCFFTAAASSNQLSISGDQPADDHQQQQSEQ